MDRADEQKYTLDEYSWHILNNLKQFDKTPNLISDVVDRIKSTIPEHPILAKFIDYFDTGFEYYENHGEFPDINFFEVNYAKTCSMKRTDDEFSMNVYDDWVKKVDAEVIKVKCNKIVNQVSLIPTELRDLITTATKYCERAEEKIVVDKDSLLNMYANYAKEYSGVRTGMRALDEKIGVLGHKSLSVFGAPSGHGKSTFAISLAYNAVMQGLCVDYVSYEVPKEHMWFNIVSMESATKGIKEVELVASEMKEAGLTELQQEIFKEMMGDFLKKAKEAGGHLNIIDKTMDSAQTYEEFKAQLEKIARERNGGNDGTFDRKADLIIIDNIDNFQVFKSPERDESVRVNNYIIDLDSFCKTYHNGDGSAIMLLTQLNRGGLDKLRRAEQEEVASEKSARIDYTVFQKFNALYEKGTCCLVGYADAGMRGRHVMNIYPVKLRNRAVPEQPIEIHADYEHSRIGGQDVVKTSVETAPKAAQALANAYDEEDFTDGEYDVSDM